MENDWFLCCCCWCLSHLVPDAGGSLLPGPYRGQVKYNRLEDIHSPTSREINTKRVKSNCNDYTTCKLKQKLWTQHLLVLFDFANLFFWDNASAELVVEVDGLVQTNCLIPLETNKMNAWKRGFLIKIITEFSWSSMLNFRGGLRFGSHLSEDTLLQVSPKRKKQHFLPCPLFSSLQLLL